MSRRNPQLSSDERGMILVVALPMAALLVGCLWYVISVGDATLHRERLQDAADATAFESAVLHARAMNAEVSLNLISASLSSLPAALRALQVIGATTASLSGDGRALLELALATDRELSPRVSEAIRIVHDTQLELRATAPLMAAAEASRNNTAFARELGAADGAIALSYAALPVKEQLALTADASKPWLLVATDAQPIDRDRRASKDASLPLVTSVQSGPCGLDDRLILPPMAATLLRTRELDSQLSELTEKLGAGLMGTVCTPRACEESALASRAPAEARQRCQAALRALPAPTASSLLDIDPGAENGNALLQTWSIARRERFAREASDERGMSLATPAAPVDIQPKNAAFAQAEYYFDCAATWEHCAADAAWSPRWTARLRRFERPDAGRDPVSARRIGHAFSRASASLESALQRGGARDARAYVAALFDAPACGQAACLH